MDKRKTDILQFFLWNSCHFGHQAISLITIVQRDEVNWSRNNFAIKREVICIQSNNQRNF